MSPNPKRKTKKKVKTPQGKADHKAPFKYRGTKGGDAYHAQLQFIQQQAHNKQVNELIKQLNTSTEFARRAREDAINEIYANTSAMEIDPHVPRSKGAPHPPPLPSEHRMTSQPRYVNRTSTPGLEGRLALAEERNARAARRNANLPTDMVSLERVVMEAPPSTGDDILSQAGTTRAAVVQQGSLRARFAPSTPQPSTAQRAAARRDLSPGMRFNMSAMMNALTEQNDHPQILAGLRRRGSEIDEDVGDNKSARYNTGEYNTNLRPYGDDDGPTGLRQRTN